MHRGPSRRDSERRSTSSGESGVSLPDAPIRGPEYAAGCVEDNIVPMSKFSKARIDTLNFPLRWSFGKSPNSATAFAK